MPFSDDEKKYMNLGLTIIGVIIIIYIYVVQVSNTKLLIAQLKECKKDIRELRKYIMKSKLN